MFSVDEVPKKKPFTLEDQVVKDKQGRRRFHGAFTGGFSAGFFNSVGSLEGWTPSQFKSSRSDKAQTHKQKAEDFMDEEVYININCLLCDSTKFWCSICMSINFCGPTSHTHIHKN